MKSKILIMFLLSIFLFYQTSYAYENKGKEFKEREFEREHTTSAIKYLRMALIELQAVSGTSNIEEQLTNLVKFLSIKNLDGDYFSQYARKNSNVILDNIKKEYLINNNSGDYNKKVLMEKRIYDRINNANKYNFDYDQKANKKGKGASGNNKNINEDIIRNFK
jgi:hypothetical protein